MPADRAFPAGPRFEIRRPLGAGAMGVVYEAFDRELQQAVALKTLTRADGLWLARFKREFRSLHDLAHPNLVAYGEFFDDADEPFFTMELVHGVDLMTHVRPTGDRFDEARLRDALAQLVVGLHALHVAGKVHRDVKPSNVLVQPDGRVVILDLGLVEELTAPDRSTGGEPVGTVAYMAPEQAFAAAVGPAADWYGLGVVLYEALTGQLPHDAPSSYELVMRKQQADVVAPAARAPGVPADLDALCVALLARDPAARPRPAELFARLGLDATAPPAAEPGPSAATITAPFVGRTDERAALWAAYRAVDDRARLCLVEGVSGVGKSQLVERFLAELALAEPDTVVLAGRCYEREVVSFKAFDGLADSLARHLARLREAEVAALMPRRPALLGRLFPVLKRIEAVAAAAPVPDVADPHDQRLRMFAALRELLQRLAERHRLVWYIDDLQWTDADSLVLLAELCAHEEPLPVFIVATARAAEDQARAALLAQIARLVPTQRLPLAELAPDDARALAAALLPGRDPAALDALAAEAGGHPLLLHELARHVDVSQGAAAGASLDEMLAARIARLDAAARRLLEVVAVAGEPLAHDVATRAAALTPGAQAQATAVLRAAHLIRTDGIRRADRVVVYHDRVREHVDGQLDDAGRRQVHERLAVALEQAGAAEHSPRALVRHARAAGRHALAATYALAAARHAGAALAFDLAAELFATAIELGEHPPAALRGLQLELATALMHAGRGPEAAATFMAVADGAEPAVRLDCQRQAAEQWIITGHLEQGMAALGSSLADIAEPPAATPRRALARVVWNRARLRLRGARAEVRRDTQVPVETLRRLDVLKAVAHGLAMIDNIRGADFNGRYLLLALRTGEARHLVGALAAEVVFLASQGGGAGRRGRRLHARLIELAARCPDPLYARTWVLLADGAAAFFEGRLPAAVAALERTEEVFADGPAGLTYEKNNARVFRVHALRLMGALRQHGGLISELLRTNRHRGDRYLETTLRLLQVQSLLARGDVAEARRNIDDVTWTPPERGYHLQHWYQLMARSELALFEADRAAAARLHPDFAALRRSLLLRVGPVRAEAGSLQGRLLLATGDPAVVRDVERLAAALEREPRGYASVAAALLRAGTAALIDRPGDAIAHLRRTVELAAAHDAAWHGAAAAAALARRIGGDEGAALAATAARFAADHDLTDAAAMFAIVAPGALAR